MVEIPAGKFRFYTKRDRYKEFITQTAYKPNDTTNYLKHWVNGDFVKGMENFPVVYISLDDARAYAAWAGKRFPTEQEWQYAAQGIDMRKFPWGGKPVRGS